jgi:hypothetical protein
MDVALVSCVDLPEPDPDAGPLLSALEAAGIEAAVVAWDEPSVDWSQAPVTILRSSWNYPWHHQEFLHWAALAAGQTRLWNPLPVVRWNSHKRYLAELEARGIPVAPTELVPAGSGRALEEIRTRRGWEETVVKPAVSAGSYRTLRVPAGSREAGEAHLRRLCAEGDALVQLYLPSVEDYGERALIWIDGELTHAVRKGPRFEDQVERIASRAAPIAPDEERLARQVLEAVEGELLYARIDLAPGPGGAPVLMELELVEPSLYFGLCSQALDRFVAAVARVVRNEA